jgi:hypothetical protein
MIIAVLLLFSTIAATWAGYWSTGMFRSLSNRASRIACLVSPGLIAVVSGVCISTFFRASGTDVDVSELTPREVTALILAFAIIIFVATLLLAYVAGRISVHLARRRGRSA